MNSTDSILIEASKNIAIGLMPIFVIMSIMLTAVLLVRDTAVKDIRHASFFKWLFVIISILLSGFAIIFGAFFFLGYFLTADISASILAFYIPATFFLQGIVQKILLKIILKPKELPDNVVNGNKKFGYALGATIPLLVISIIRIIDLDPQSKLIYFLAPIFIAIPYVLIYIYVTKINKSKNENKQSGSLSDKSVNIESFVYPENIKDNNATDNKSNET